MRDLAINSFQECKMCGECCKTPCDLIPTDLAPLLDRFDTSLSQFFKKYLIALIIASPSFSDEILMMVPVRVGAKGTRPSKYLSDVEYLKSAGKCIFLKDIKCSIHESKPFGGRYLKCPKMTGTVSIQLPKDQYFAYWANNQHLFYSIFPGYQELLADLKTIYNKKNSIHITEGKSEKYERLNRIQGRLITERLFPLFNGSTPIGGYSVSIK